MTVRVVQVRSSIGIKPKQRGTLRALGLHGIGTARDHSDTPVLRGMLAKVPHLVRVEETQSPRGDGGRSVRRRSRPSVEETS